MLFNTCACARRIDTVWDSTYRVPVQIDTFDNVNTHLKRSVMGYDAQGRLMTSTNTDMLTNESRTVTRSYDTNGLLASVDGPRTDVTDTTTYVYDATGNLTSTTNALGQATQITAHDGHGRPLTLQGPNGAITQLSYDARGRLLSRTEYGQDSFYSYDAMGNLTNLSLPNGTSLTYTYDAANRLTAIEDNQSNRLEYTLDAFGNRTKEDTRDPAGLLKRTIGRVYDDLSRLTQVTGGAGQTENYGYDANGNRITVTDGRQEITQSAYDPLNRLMSSTDPLNDITNYSYDALDNLVQVTDPNGLITDYSYNALGDLLQVDSPDTGITTYSYDSGGNRSSQTDARGVVINYNYDILNRVTFTDYADNSLDVSYTYDENTAGENGIGRLTEMVDASGTTNYRYDLRSNLINKQSLIDGTTYTTAYSYNGANQLTSMSYPSGQVVNYNRNTLGQVDSVTSTVDGVTETLASGIGYAPFGPLIALTYGNGLIEQRTFDQAYRLATLDSGNVLSRTYQYDLVDNITGITDNLDINGDQLFSYDVLNRLNSANGIYGSMNYQYDANGNRTIHTHDSETFNYSYTPGSHHLNQVQNGVTIGYQNDANGNTIDNSSFGFQYGDNNRMQTVTVAGQPLATHTYNGRGERVKKVGADTTIYNYDENGQLIVESDDLGNVQKEYIYLDGNLIATLVPGSGNNPDPAEQVLDNTDPGTTNTGDWPASTVVSGYEGMDYQHHFANGPSPDGIVVDNGDASFSVTGSWPTSTVVAGFEGTNYQHHVANGPSPDSIVVDNEDAGFSVVGTWNTSTSVGGYTGNNYQANAAGTGSDISTWTISIPSAGDYEVFARWTSHANRATNAKYVVTHSDGAGGTTTTVVSVNQQSNGGQDESLGTFNFDAGNTTITLSDDADGYVIADSITLVPPGAQPNTATWALTVPITGDYEVYAKWTSHSNRATNAPYVIQHAAGSTTVTVNQQVNGEQYNLLGTYSFNSGTGYQVSLADEADGYVIADAVQIIPVGGTRNTTTWQPILSQAAEYEVFARWTAHPNRATNAPYSITHTGGISTVTVNQQANGGTFYSLGVYTLDENSKIQLTDEADGYVIADAVKLVRTGTPVSSTTEIYYFHNDHLGTPQALTDTSQAVVWQADYNPFGEAAITINTIENNIRFPGQYYDEETGLHYNYHRYYDSSTGRYITSDPIGLNGGVNTYRYANGGPMNWADPHGLDAIPIIFPDYRPALPSNWPGVGGSRPFAFGHAGSLIFDPNSGLTRYYEFGRYSSLEGECGCGAVQNYQVPNLTIGNNGQPTQESLNRVFSSISKRSGGGTRISAVHIPAANFSTMNAYGLNRLAQNNNPNREPYGFSGNNCSQFVYDMLNAGGVSNLPWLFNPTPENLFDELQEEGYTQFAWPPR